MRKIFYILLVVILSLPCTASASNKDKDSYNISRARELFAANDYESATEYINKELADNPKCAEAYCMLGYIHLTKEENGQALTALNKALTYYPKKSKHSRALVYYYRYAVNLAIQDTVSAVKDIDMANQLVPEDKDFMQELAKAHVLTENYPAAISVYERMRKMDAGDTLPLLGLAYIAIAENRFDDARDYAAKIRLLSPNDNNADRIEMRIAQMEDKHNEVLNKAIILQKQTMFDEESLNAILIASDSIYSHVISALTKQAFTDKANEDNWNFIKAICHERHHDYKTAVAIFDGMAKTESDIKAYAMRHLIDCYDNMDDIEQMEATLLQYLEIFPEDAYLTIKLADTRFYSGRYAKAKEGYKRAMELEPEYGGFCFYRLGWAAEMEKDYTLALEMYDKSIALDDDFAYVLMNKGFLLKDHLNRGEEAKEMFRLCIEKDSIKEAGTSMQYAYVGLDMRDKAIETMDKIISLNTNNAGNYYDAACVYSRLGENDKAIAYLRTAFEKGYTRLHHLETDDDMDPLREMPEFKQLLKEYAIKGKTEEEILSMAETVTYEIPLRKDYDGTYYLKASVNGLTMNFVLDTGASTVSLSQVESQFMLKNGYLSKADFHGESRYSDANGNVNTGQIVNLSKIKIGDLEINNIKAGVVQNQRAPLLLGQSVLNNFGRVEIDTKKHILRITTNK